MLDKDVRNHLGRQLRAMFDGVRRDRAEAGLAKPRPAGQAPVAKSSATRQGG